MPQVEWKWIKLRTQNEEYIPNLFEWFNLVVFYKQCSYHEEANEETAITGSDDSENSHQQKTKLKITVMWTISGKAVAGFAVNAWGPFVIFYDQNQENRCLKLYICVWVFKYRRVPIDQVFCTRCMLCLLQSWRFQLIALPGQTMQRTKNT